MSLINDALKRASKLPPPADLPPEQVSAQFRPIDYPKPSKAWLSYLLPLGVMIVMGTGGYLFLTGWDVTDGLNFHGAKFRALARQSTPSEAPAAKPKPESAPKLIPVAPENTPASNNAVPTALTPAVPDTTPAPPRSEAIVPTIAPPAPQVTTIKLQGIFYRPGHPGAMINGKTVLVGDMISGAKIVTIRPDSVVIQINGQNKELTLAQ